MKRYWVQFLLPELAGRCLTEAQQRSHLQGPFATSEAAKEWAEGACQINGCSRFRVYRLDTPIEEIGCYSLPTKRFVIQASFVGSHGRPANQFYGGTSTASGYPLWMNLLSQAVQYESEEQARSGLDRIHDRKASHTYSVVATDQADETASRKENANVQR